MQRTLSGLEGPVHNELKQTPTSCGIFIFISWRRNQLKIMQLQKDWYPFYHKLLEKGTLELPTQAVCRIFDSF